MDFAKLAKVLALAASDNQAEALHALSTARRLLEADGADFVELARRLADPPQPAENEAMEDAIFDLRNEIRHLRAENERLRQGRGAPAPAAEPGTFGDAARAAADGIRLRAELTAMAEELAGERAELARLRGRETAHAQTMHDARGEIAALAARLDAADARRMRLEAENRRLLHANHALTVERDEARDQAARPLAAVAPSPMATAVAAAALPLTPPVPEPASPRKGRRGGRAKAQSNQFALF